MQLQLLSWNILFDGSVKHHPYQAERIPEIVKTIESSIEDPDMPIVLYMCEISKPDNFNSIVRALKMNPAAAPVLYHKNLSYLGFAYKNIDQPKLTNHDLGKFKRRKYQSIEVEDINIYGLHYPQPQILGLLNRLALSKKVLSDINGKEKQIVTADFNAFQFTKERKSFIKAGMNSTHENVLPKFPNPIYRGKNIPKIIPEVCIDTMYYTPDIKVIKTKATLSDASDHPLISTVFEIS